jgi:hypothetical protein
MRPQKITISATVQAAFRIQSAPQPSRRQNQSAEGRALHHDVPENQQRPKGQKKSTDSVGFSGTDAWRMSYIEHCIP